jgi:hypothetical protein
MSDRLYEVLRARAGRRTVGEHGKPILLAREKATLPEDLVLYCGRHDYGTRVLSNTGEPHSGHGRRWGTGV